MCVLLPWLVQSGLVRSSVTTVTVFETHESFHWTHSVNKDTFFTFAPFLLSLNMVDEQLPTVVCFPKIS